MPTPIGADVLTLRFLLGNGDGTFQSTVTRDEGVVSFDIDAEDAGIYYEGPAFQITTLKNNVQVGGGRRDVVCFNGVMRWWDGTDIQSDGTRLLEEFRGRRGTAATILESLWRVQWVGRGAHHGAHQARAEDLLQAERLRHHRQHHEEGGRPLSQGRCYGRMVTSVLKVGLVKGGTLMPLNAAVMHSDFPFSAAQPVTVTSLSVPFGENVRVARET